MQAQQGIELKVPDIKLVYGSMQALRSSLVAHISWLKSLEGDPIPGTEVAIEEVMKEISDLNKLITRVYTQCFIPKTK